MKVKVATFEGTAEEVAAVLKRFFADDGDKGESEEADTLSWLANGGVQEQEPPCKQEMAKQGGFTKLRKLGSKDKVHPSEPKATMEAEVKGSEPEAPCQYEPAGLKLKQLDMER